MTTPVATEPGPPPATTSDGRPRRSPRRVAVISLFTTADVVRRSLSTVVERRGITLQQYNVLRILRGGEEDGLPTLTIAERMIEQTPGITRLLDRIEARGWVRRERATEDRRQVRCWITPEGLALLAELDAPVDAVERAAFDGVEAPELSSLTGLLDRIRHAAQSHARAARGKSSGAR